VSSDDPVEASAGRDSLIKVLRPAAGRGEEPGDFNWCQQGELLTLGTVCDRDFREDMRLCGCRRSFTGVITLRSCTVAVVDEAATSQIDRELAEAPGLSKNDSEGWPGYSKEAADRVNGMSRQITHLHLGVGALVRVRLDRDGRFELRQADADRL
jgi:hypothetical protein